MITIGILADTHLSSVDDDFARQCAAAFADCDTIIHAGDLIDIGILSVFHGKKVHAVCGNMCNNQTRQALPEEKIIDLGGYSIAITHGAGPRETLEARVFERFPTADCIIFGHSHAAVCRKFGDTLLVNPGSFLGTGRHGAAGTYGLLTIGPKGVAASIHPLPSQP